MGGVLSSTVLPIRLWRSVSAAAGAVHREQQVRAAMSSLPLCLWCSCRRRSGCELRAAVLVDQGPGNLVAVHREHVDEGNGNLSPMLASVKKRTLHSDLVYVCPKVEQGVQ